MNKPLHPDLLRALQQHMRAVYVCVRETVGVAEGQVYVGLGGEVEDAVDGVEGHTGEDVGGVGDVAVVEGEVWVRGEDGGVIQGGAVGDVVEGDDVVGGVGQDQVADEPACSE